MHVLLSFVVLAAGAPAPLPRSNPDGAEVVFDAQTKERARLARLRLRSLLLELPAQEGPAPSVTVAGDGAVVRLRLGGRADALLLVRALAKRLSEPFADTSDGLDRQMQMRLAGRLRERCAMRLKILEQMKQPGQDRLDVDADVRRMEEALARYEFEAEPLKVASSPRAVRRVR